MAAHRRSRALAYSDLMVARHETHPGNAAAAGPAEFRAAVESMRRASLRPPAPQRIVLRPEPVRGGSAKPFVVTREGDLWRVRGEKPERWVRQTDFNNTEAVGYLADRLNRIGIEDRLLELGARAGDGVAIGGADAVVFDFRPGLDAGAENLARRGEDSRFDESRPAARRCAPGSATSRRPPASTTT